jgi:hypothetical protein
MRSGLFCVLGILLLLSIGCEDSISGIPVSGTVKHKGEAVEGATVAFHGGKQMTSARTDASGHFQAEVEAGEHKITISKLTLSGAPASESISMDDAAKQATSRGALKPANETNALPAIYAKPETTPLKETVAAGKALEFNLE